MVTLTGMQPDPVIDAELAVRDLFPRVRWAVVAGSVLTEARTPGSDLDLVVVLDEDPQVPYRRSLRWRAWPVELFVHNGQTLRYYRETELGQRKPSLHRMLALGVTVAGDPVEAATVRQECARVLAAGPAALTPAELDRARYGLTDLLDDLTHGPDAGERTVLTTTLWLGTAELALSLARHWTGGGKWLLRELRDLDPGLAGRWVAAHGDPAAVAALAREVLDRAGGPLFDGFRQAGRRP